MHSPHSCVYSDDRNARLPYASAKKPTITVCHCLATMLKAGAYSARATTSGQNRRAVLNPLCRCTLALRISGASCQGINASISCLM
jgi:hypothetical protein